VMDRLEPGERLAFVLHDLFAVPFDEIAAIVGRTPAAARQLASRARRRVRGTQTPDDRPVEGARAATVTDLEQQRAVIDAFLAAARAGDLQGLLAVLDPNVTYRAADLGGPAELAGSSAVAPLAMRGRAVAARPLLVNGAIGVVVAPRGRLMMILDFAIRDGKVIAIDAVAAPARVAALDLAVLDE
ncbi:MAG: sigma factor-like helix-turn-helix DNA-binding protein, partial [Thermomicrobiales bacterium]